MTRGITPARSSTSTVRNGTASACTVIGRGLVIHLVVLLVILLIRLLVTLNSAGARVEILFNIIIPMVQGSSASDKGRLALSIPVVVAASPT